MTEGTVITFYSYKGGVGRTLALANIGALLCRWGYKVLCIDWDLEAPGLQLYFEDWINQTDNGGIVDLVIDYVEGKEPKWQDYVVPVNFASSPFPLSLINAGRLNKDYPSRMQSLNWMHLYEHNNLGSFIEQLRDEWKSSFDFILIDSRTGMTDIGGVCTVQLPDILISLFTANKQNLYGSIDVLNSILRARSGLPFDRAKLWILPVATRFELRVEYELAELWLNDFADALGPFYSEWAHKDVSALDLLKFTRVPYIPYWSFGERLPVIEKGTEDPEDIGFSFESLAALIAHKLAGNALLINKRDSFVAEAQKDYKSADLTASYRERIAEWSQPRYVLDKRFVNLTLLLDKGESELQRWQRAPEEFRFNDLRDVLAKAKDDPALVLLGAPGSGKSTLLRRLELDHSADRLRDGREEISFFIQLNEYHGEQSPYEWLMARWSERYPRLPRLETWLQKGRALLLLDALNEMQPRTGATYHDLVGWWREFVQKASRDGNRIVFSCRSLDYSAPLSTKDLPVPQVEVQPMNREQVREFLRAYTPAHEERVWNDLDGSPQFGLFQTPYFMKLLCDQIEGTGEMPKGRAALLTGFVRQVLYREVEKTGELFQPGALLTERDYKKLSRREWRSPFELPEQGLLIPKLSDLAFTMQEKGLGTEGAQVRIDYDDACDLLAYERAEGIIKAGLALNVLDEYVALDKIAFFHQLLQEYFAARRLAKEPNPALVRVEWAVEQVRPTLSETLAGLADGDPLPPLPQTGWEETTLTAAPMGKDQQGFIRALIPHNLPLAARCATSPEVSITAELKREIQTALIARTQDQRADLRARIAAGEALGLIGDPRFERRTGPNGEYLLPPLVEFPGGTYPMGDDKSDYDLEKPAHKVELAPSRIGQFPVTNAEYALFMAAGGYEDEQWWDTPESLEWLCGEGSTESIKQQWRDNRKLIQSWSEDYVRGMVTQNRITSKQAEDWIIIRNWTEEEFEQWLDDNLPSGKLYRQPEYWDDTRFNNPAHPVVGVTWFEARAYCNWLTANEGIIAGKGEKLFRLPTEAEFEAAARGNEGRLFPYGKTFDASRSNTFESHIRRTTPVGIFDNATPEGAVDLSGNTYTWTLSIYDQERFPYPYRSDDGREDIHQAGVRRVLRGGSWYDDQMNARAVARDNFRPAGRGLKFGFRVVSVLRPPSS